LKAGGELDRCIRDAASLTPLQRSNVYNTCLKLIGQIGVVGLAPAVIGPATLPFLAFFSALSL
jgi:hypothetical protein